VLKISSFKKKVMDEILHEQYPPLPPAVFCFFSFCKTSHVAAPLPYWIPWVPEQPVQVDEHASRKVHTAALTICGCA